MPRRLGNRGPRLKVCHSTGQGPVSPARGVRVYSASLVWGHNGLWWNWRVLRLLRLLIPDISFMVDIAQQTWVDFRFTMVYILYHSGWHAFQSSSPKIAFWIASRLCCLLGHLCDFSGVRKNGNKNQWWEIIATKQENPSCLIRAFENCRLVLFPSIPNWVATLLPHYWQVNPTNWFSGIWIHKREDDLQYGGFSK